MHAVSAPAAVHALRDEREHLLQILLREPRLTVRMDERPADVLQRLGASEANGAYVLDGGGRILGVIRDETLAQAVSLGRTEIAPDDLTQDFRTTGSDRPLIDLVNEVGRHVVPLAVVDEANRLLGVVPRATVLASLAAPSRT